MREENGSGRAGTYHLTDHWLAEALRLRETLWGPLEDSSESRRARTEGTDFREKVLLRARYLAKREKLNITVQGWRDGSRLVLVAMLLAAVLAGAGAAIGVLGDGGRPVNLILALAGMLGLNTLALLFWLLSFAYGGNASGGGLGELWLWFTRKLAHGPDAALAPRALIELLGRQGSLRWLLGGISHGWWTTALAGMLVTLLALLSARRYTFNWETTLLSPDTFVALTAALGWLPSRLGFPVPTEAMVRASDGLHVLPESAQALWSGWLIGGLIVYGLVPRLIALVLSMAMARKRLATLYLDESLPGYTELRDRLMPTSEKAGIDAPDGPGYQAHLHPVARAIAEPDQTLLVGIELPKDLDWPPAGLASAVRDLGTIDTRPERKALLDRLQEHGASQLLMACDARQTPDRGTIALLADLASLAALSHVILVPAQAGTAHPLRVDAWQSQLVAAGFSPSQIHTDPVKLLARLHTQSTHADTEDSHGPS